MTNDAPMYSVSYYKPQSLVRLDWLAGTAGMTDEDFKGALDTFAEGILQHRPKRLVVDMREFKYRPSPEALAWRDDVIVSKYNKAGVQKVAWIWPGVTGGPATSARDTFENHYCSTESEALAWIAD